MSCISCDNFVHQALIQLKLEKNNLLQCYFSDVNIAILQKTLKIRVHKESGFSIDNQDSNELYHIMLRVYQEYARNTTSKCTQEVNKLNEIVLRLSTPLIVSEINSYKMFLKDSQKPPELLQRSVNSSIKGSNTLEHRPFF
tara:strand:+ start:3935 stop:4357 length:423 start_codon:yes stop_codon:yes gene_type:complete